MDRKKTNTRKRYTTTTSASQIVWNRFYKGRPARIAEGEQTGREMALGMKIRRLREDAGLTQEQLAKKIGTGASAISRIEDADYDGHSLDTLHRVAKALDMRLIIDFQPIKRPQGTAKQM
jgi:ribosome-binding protein aMBF1 (putative translation factor)